MLLVSVFAAETASAMGPSITLSPRDAASGAVFLETAGPDGATLMQREGREALIEREILLDLLQLIKIEHSRVLELRAQEFLTQK